eukprot:TRINITY_DN13049_c0_g1_i1.p1 TRINITY_DN13049_c0_g1~~TRINITY_DN13049_c0_g1_i1.p1  ORF type:complete len:535 (-),score=224.80 TRINITY_DN13049_c0_g1_i1:73-1677(-)
MGSVCSEIPDLPEVVEGVVCQSNLVVEGQMKEVEMDGYKILLVREKGELRALSAFCTHYGAPLIKGAYDGGGKIRCPWHGACFNSETGDIEDFPGLDSLACHKVEERNGQVVVTADKRELVSGRRLQMPVDVLEDTEDRVVVVGGGAAGHTAVETLRQEGYGGAITLVTKEQHLPYDRPKLSKNLGVKPEQICLRKAGWYEKAKIEVVKGTEVVRVDKDDKMVFFDNGDSIKYSKLLLATGGEPRKLGVPGEDLGGVTTLRNITQANMIQKESVKRHVVIIGTSFIGMEVAAALVDTAASVTVIGRDPVPFLGSLGEEVGRFMLDMHRKKGVQFCLEEDVKEFQGSNGALENVILKSDRTLKADLAVVGVGVVPATGAFRDIPGIDTDKRGYIPVDSRMATSVSSIFAAGDIVSFPLLTYGGERVTIGHWGLAMYLGRVAALNIMGKGREAHTVPFFWTVQFGASLRYAGLGSGWDSVIFQQEDEKLLAMYCKGDTVCAVATMGRDPVAATFANLVKAGGVVRKEEALEWAGNI